jgi:hypothetical protein
MGLFFFKVYLKQSDSHFGCLFPEKTGKRSDCHLLF